ncbi:MAG TPA: ATP-binding protein [Pyrinomonadaceae bacterium]
MLLEEVEERAASVVTAAQHFRLYFYAAVLRLLEHCSRTFDSWEEVFAEHPFLLGYYQELTTNGLDGMSLADASDFWRQSIGEREEATGEHLPVRALREATGLDFEATILLLTIGLVEEDARFGTMFESMHVAAGQHRPTVGLLNELWQDTAGEVQRPLRRLEELGLVQVLNRDAPRVEWALQVPGLLWDALRGETHERLAPWARYRTPEELLTADELIVPASLREQLGVIPALLTTGEVRTLVVRGPRHNGRRTLLGAVARRLGLGVIEAEGLQKADDERWRLLAPLATMLNAMPLVVLEVAPGEAAEIPALEGASAPLGLALGTQGGLNGAGVECSHTLTLGMPSPAERRRLWARGFDGREYADAEEVVGRFRMTSGNIQRTARLALTCATLEGRSFVTPADVRQASRALNRQTLDTLATRVEVEGDWGHLAAGAETLRELSNLESRCRHRENLLANVGESLGAQMNCGVRALFSGPSGTGKTLAARLLASSLRMDLYRLDLSSVVNKYIGETEKSLNQIFARAEELDVILLLDEGDALLTQRTNVNSSNDRYANLETNFLLQRLETFEGIIVVTTNASERIDGAFQRRMDVVVDFRAPEPAERWQIWRLHLPANHSVDSASLEEVAQRCALTGGQIRNAVLHASLLALDDGQVITSAHLEAAVQREYRKAGAVCPLRPAGSARGEWN